MTKIIVTIFLGLFLLAVPQASRAETDENSAPAPPKISLVSYVTWWSHDATGYHPAIYLKYENDSGHDLSGQLIKFQCRFTDVRNGYVTISRKEMRTDLEYTHRQFVILRGPTPFELPIDENSWPNIECKAMCRVGEVGDEGTQDLILCRLDSITMTDDEALEKLNRQDDIRKANFASGKTRKRPHTDSQEKPLVTKMPLLHLAGQTAGLVVNGKTKKSGGPGSSLDYSLSTKGPGLGDDFFNFEQAFRPPGGRRSQCRQMDLGTIPRA